MNHHYSTGVSSLRLRAMQLNHLDLQVTDVPSTLAFFQKYFGFCACSSPSPAIAILTNDSGFVLVLQRARQDARYPDGYHLGFLLEDDASVRALQVRARADGVPVSDVIENGRGTLVYFTRPEGYLVEVSRPKRRFTPAPAAANGGQT
jgi:catechol-2,3-dioxygenase